MKRMDRDYHAIKIVMAAALSKWDREKSRQLHPDSYWLEAAEVALRWSAPAIRTLERERTEALPAAKSVLCYGCSEPERCGIHRGDICAGSDEMFWSLSDGEQVDMSDEVRRLQAENAELDRAVTEEIDQRDANAEWADRLAYAIGSIHEIGEHSSANNPWAQAIELLENQRAEVSRLSAALVEAEQREQALKTENVSVNTDEGKAMDWLLNWASAQDSRVPRHYFHLCDGEATCGCPLEGEESRV